MGVIKMIRRYRSVGFLAMYLWLSGCFLTPLGGWLFGKEETRPNVIVFLSDDQGWGDFGFQGNNNFRTPHLDSLAADGAVFTRFYVCPVCAPTRAEFLTGRYHPRGSAVGVTQGDERLDLDEITLADRFSSAGYRTGVFGKWHNGSQYPYHPNGRGFQEFYGFCSGHWGDYFSPPLERNGKRLQGVGYVSDDFTNHAIEFIRTKHDQPFLCYVAFNTPHTPMQVPDDFMERVRDRALPMRYENRKGEQEELEMTRAAIAMVENIDWNVGRILAVLDELGIANDSIVVYFNDNGPNSFRWNGGMKGRKGSVDEGGVRSPLIVRWPGRIPASRRISQLSGAIDLTPTLCDLAGIGLDKVPQAYAERLADHPLDGISHALRLTADEPEVERELFSQWSGRIAMRRGSYVLAADGKLFDLSKDPGQSSACNEQYPDVVQQMQERVEKWKVDVLKSAKPRRPFLLGHPQRSWANLPAQDGKCGGPNVVRSNTAPNCSFFTMIRSPEDRIRWEVEVLQAGEYRIEAMLTVPKEAIGSSLCVRIGERECIGVLREAHDSKLYGDGNDRVPRNTESLMKRFASFELGSVFLDAGAGEIEVQLTGPLAEGVGLDLQGLDFELLK